MQSEVDAAIKKLQELKLVLGEHQKVSSSAAMQPGGLQTHSAPTPGDSPCTMQAAGQADACSTGNTSAYFYLCT